MNTRKTRKPVAFTITASPDVENSKPTSSGKKRRSTTAANELRNDLDNSNASNTSATSTGSKRTRRDQNLVSYSRPGPPTPARTKGNKSINSSDVSLTSANSNLVSGL